MPPPENPGGFSTKKRADFGGVKTRPRNEQPGVFGKLFQSIKRAPRRGQFSGFFENWPKFDPKISPFLVLLVFSFTSISTVFHKGFHENFEVIFQEKSGKIWSFLPPTPPNFEIFLSDKKSTVCYRKLHFLWKVGLGGSIGEDGISFFQFFEKKLTILIHRAQKSMVFSRKMGSKKWVKFNKK